MSNLSRTKRTPDAAVSIAAVERDYGLSKDTLRVWERRYGFPRPTRDSSGERLYPPDQVEKLSLLRRLVDAGHRPGRIARLAADELRALADGPAAASSPEASAETRALLDALIHDAAGDVRDLLATALVRHGLARFAGKIAPELATEVGAAWARGDLAIHQEHLFTAMVSTVLRGAMDRVVAEPGLRRPKVLLTTFPQEPHALGLLMAEAILALEDCDCVSLGVQTPIPSIAAAARAHGADIVALSFSPIMARSSVRAGLAELRQLAPADAEIWAGGSSAGLKRAEGARVLRSLDSIRPAVADWRSRHDMPRGGAHA